MNTTITLKQLRNDLPAVIEAVSKGRHFTVIKRSRPVFEITPPEDEGWEFDFTENGYPNGIPASELYRIMVDYKRDNPDKFDD